jgi:hypothetical protein
MSPFSERCPALFIISFAFISVVHGQTAAVIPANEAAKHAGALWEMAAATLKVSGTETGI